LGDTLAAHAEKERSLAQQGRTGIGIIGTGVISEIYLKNLTSWPDVEVIAVSDIFMDKAKERGEQFNVPAVTVDELLADPRIDVVINLTIPAAHGEVGLKVVEAGKSVYNEKPLSTTRDVARALLDSAAAKGVRVGGAPDTFLGGSLQTCRALLDAGVIGTPVAASAFFVSPGPESWHPAPEFFYLAGGGPMLDMGPYYITALVNLLGPIRRVTGSARITRPERTVTSRPDNIRDIPVEVPTYFAGVLDFASGPIATLVTSFDVWAAELPRIEIYGIEGTLSVPDPNNFTGTIKLYRHDTKAWVEQPVTAAFQANSRGLGARDLARALRDGGAHRASGDLAYHVLDVMLSVEESSRAGTHIELSSTVDRPEPLTPFE
jgi:predicted dehydrogenase